ncbi:MAG: hypothetical protein JETCAE03_19650 [Ignavibacteriaceae bacterium]|nr:MAG: hypothetical protein BroJett017_18280 [Ignavibacteriota bacterium]GJQ42467.1 MAG: hypothetical protein JETCAE03_19650 [Ignavibacteriaceae bacterium]
MTFPNFTEIKVYSKIKVILTDVLWYDSSFSPEDKCLTKNYKEYEHRTDDNDFRCDVVARRYYVTGKHNESYQ